MSRHLPDAGFTTVLCAGGGGVGAKVQPESSKNAASWDSTLTVTVSAWLPRSFCAQRSRTSQGPVMPGTSASFRVRSCLLESLFIRSTAVLDPSHDIGL